MGRNNWYNNGDDFILGANSRNGNGSGNGFNGNGNGFNGVMGAEDEVETIVSPTQTVVNPITNRRTIRRVHPTHIVNVNRNITRIENFYPVTQSVENVDSVEEYNCGSDLRNPCCKPVKRHKKKCCD